MITDISRDGMLTGPDVEGLAESASSTHVPVIASGGVGALAHIQQLALVAGLNGVIVGKALYEEKFSVADAVAVLA